MWAYRIQGKLSRDEMKNIMAGDVVPGGGCVLCHVNTSMESCWYTDGDPDALCSRVYPGGYTSTTGVTCYPGCHLN